MGSTTLVFLIWAFWLKLELVMRTILGQYLHHSLQFLFMATFFFLILLLFIPLIKFSFLSLTTQRVIMLISRFKVLLHASNSTRTIHPLHLLILRNYLYLHRSCHHFKLHLILHSSYSFLLLMSCSYLRWYKLVIIILSNSLYARRDDNLNWDDAPKWRPGLYLSAIALEYTSEFLIFMSIWFSSKFIIILNLGTFLGSEWRAPA